ncbi:6,7-dimethyl-8-ribityllumazine synthase [candidate division KSB1 bacterium]|nr:6,7-dimethyl-8-ribityllumazine synthase [candidate division KSB1 bacterium]
MNIALVVSDFNHEITAKMEKNAEKITKQLNVKITKKIHVPGAFEIPFAAKKLFKDKKINAVVVLGAVVQGETDHDIIIVSSISKKLLDLSLQYDKPLGFGIIGPRVTRQQAQKRAAGYAERAVKTALEMTKLRS